MHQAASGGFPLRCIVYGSTAADLWSDSDLGALVAQAQARNSNQAITGVIAYRNRQFIQVLEGPQDAVEGLFDAIQRDKRHHQLRLLLRRNVSDRAFSGWSMAVANDDGASGMSDVRQAIDALQSAVTLARSDLLEICNAPVPQGATQLRLPTQQGRARDTVERIFGTARSIVLRAGVAALSVPEVAQQAGVTQPTFYRYFGDIDELLRAGMLRIALRRLEDWRAVIQAHHFTSDAHLADMLTTIGSQNFLKMSGMPPDLVRAALPHLAMVAQEISRVLAVTVLEAMARCNLPGANDIDEEMMAALLAGLIGAGGALATNNIDRLRTEEARRVAAGMFLGGLRAAYK